MARRTVLTSRQRSALFALPQREADLLRHYTLSDEDLQNIGAKRRPRNKLGFALQLCVLRYPGRLLVPAEFVPPPVVDFIGRQIDLDGDELADYAVRSETRHEHLAELRHLYGFRSFSGGAARELGDRLREEAPQAQSNEDLVRRFVEACRRTRTILPATTTIERLCADALVDAERRGAPSSDARTGCSGATTWRRRVARRISSRIRFSTNVECAARHGGSRSRTFFRSEPGPIALEQGLGRPGAAAPSCSFLISRTSDPLERVDASTSCRWTAPLEAVVGPDGQVTDVRVLRSAVPLLDEAAIEAVRQWTYTPTFLGRCGGSRHHAGDGELSVAVS